MQIENGKSSTFHLGEHTTFGGCMYVTWAGAPNVHTIQATVRTYLGTWVPLPVGTYLDVAVRFA